MCFRKKKKAFFTQRFSSLKLLILTKQFTHKTPRAITTNTYISFTTPTKCLTLCYQEGRIHVCIRLSATITTSSHVCHGHVRTRGEMCNNWLTRTALQRLTRRPSRHNWTDRTWSLLDIESCQRQATCTSETVRRTDLSSLQGPFSTVCEV